MYNELCELGGSVLTNQDWGEKTKKDSTNLELFDKNALQDREKIKVSSKKCLMTEKSKG